MTEHGVGPSAAWGRLMAPGERIGWIFRDRASLAQGFAEPPPVLGFVPPQVMEKAWRAQGKLSGRLVRTIFAGLAVTGVFGCCAGIGNASRDSSIPIMFGTLAVFMLLATAGFVTLLVVRHRAAVNGPQRVSELMQRQHADAVVAWQARREAFATDQWQRLSALPQWGAAVPGGGARRLDVVGGSLWGWEALLTVFGTSMLATHGPLTVVDLSGESVCRELVRLATMREKSVDLQVLPDGLADSDLLSGLDGRQLVDVIVESMHASTQTDSRTDRAMDDRILSGVVAALGEQVTVGRIAAAVRVLMGEPGTSTVLSPAERAYVADEVFSDAYKQHAHDNLRRIESHLHPLARLGEHADARPSAELTCLVVDSDGRNVRGELLTDLMVQWLTRRVATDPAHNRTLVIVGADDLSRRHVERLSDLCERRGVRLTLLYRHLRETSLQVLGAGAVVFMRLGNHEEATRAADFIGREHKFVLSQLTHTLGGSDTHTEGTSQGEAVGQGDSITDTLSGGVLGFLHLTDNWSQGRTRSWNKSRSWSTNQSRAAGSTWSDATSQQRVYEYQVEPRTLQDLPDYAMLLVESTPTGPVVRPVECNPDLVSLDDVSMDPLPAVTVPAQHTPTGLPSYPGAPAALPAGQQWPAEQQWQQQLGPTWQQGGQPWPPPQQQIGQPWNGDPPSHSR